MNFIFILKCRPVISGEAEVSKFYGCPRSPFPTTRLTPTTTTIIPETLVPNVSASENNFTDESTVGKNFEETTPEDIDPLTTSIPFDMSPDYALLNGKKTTTPLPKGSEKPWILWIVLIVVICLITTFSLLFAIWRPNKSKNKINEKSLQNKNKEIVTNSFEVNEKSNSEKSVPDVKPTKSDSDSSKVEKQSSDEIPLYANSWLKTSSVRSEISESEESLGTSMKKTNSSLTTKSSEESTSKLSVKSAPVKEADEMLDAIKSSEGIQ